MSDTHYLGEFQSLSAVWKMFPNGAGYGDYITIGGVRYDWDESTNSWGEDPGDVNPALPEIVNHDIDVQGTVIARDGIKTADYIPDEAGAHIDHAGNAEFRTLKADTIRLQDPITGKLIPLAEFIKMFKTELPPDWSEYTQIPQFDDVRILAFDPISDEKFYTTIGSLKQLIRDSIAAGGVGTGTFDIEILRTDDPDAIPTDNNVMSSLRTLMAIQAAIASLTGRYLSRINDDTAQGLITFLRGLTSEQIAILEKGWKTKEFVPGLVGTGANFDEFGYGEMRGLRLWEFLEVPELRFNRVNIYTGIRWDTFGGGIIESVEIDTDELGNELQSGIITLKLEDGEYGAIATDDLCQGIFHNFGGSNDDVNEDQRNGNFRFKGFNTSYFRITEVLDESNKTFRYVLRGLSERWTQQHHPKPQMHFACYANPTNTERQACTYTTTEYSIGLHNMTTWEYGEANIHWINGKLDGFQLGETVFEGSGSVIGNGYFYGSIQSIENAPYILELDHDNDGFLAFGESMTITCRLMKGFEDKTGDVEVWQVTRESGNQIEDTAWNIAHQNFNGQITITHTQEYTDLGDGISTLFRFVATLGNETTITELTI